MISASPFKPLRGLGAHCTDRKRIAQQAQRDSHSTRVSVRRISVVHMNTYAIETLSCGTFSHALLRRHWHIERLIIAFSCQWHSRVLHSSARYACQQPSPLRRRSRKHRIRPVPVQDDLHRLLWVRFLHTPIEDIFNQPYSITLSGLFDPSVDFQFGFVLPIGNKSTEFIAEFIVPVAKKWAGISLGEGQRFNPLIMAWPYHGGVQHSVRYSTDWVYPLPYAGPIVTTLHTKTNATHWDWVFRCQNCTSMLSCHTLPQYVTHIGQQPGTTASASSIRPARAVSATFFPLLPSTHRPTQTQRSPSTTSTTSHQSTFRRRTPPSTTVTSSVRVALHDSHRAPCVPAHATYTSHSTTVSLQIAD
jgi:hypothetical protein